MTDKKQEETIEIVESNKFMQNILQKLALEITPEITFYLQILLTFCISHNYTYCHLNKSKSHCVKWRNFT